MPHIHKRHHEETTLVWQLLKIVFISQIVWLLSYWEIFYSWMFWSLNSNWFFLSEMTLCLKSERLDNSLKSSSRFIRRNLWVAFAISWIPPFARFSANYISSENFTTFINTFLRMMLHQRIMSHSSLSESGYWLRWYCFVSFAM